MSTDQPNPRIEQIVERRHGRRPPGPHVHKAALLRGYRVTYRWDRYRRGHLEVRFGKRQALVFDRPGPEAPWLAVRPRVLAVLHDLAAVRPWRRHHPLVERAHLETLAAAWDQARPLGVLYVVTDRSPGDLIGWEWSYRTAAGARRAARRRARECTVEVYRRGDSGSWRRLADRWWRP